MSSKLWAAITRDPYKTIQSQTNFYRHTEVTQLCSHYSNVQSKFQVPHLQMPVCCIPGTFSGRWPPRSPSSNKQPVSALGKGTPMLPQLTSCEWSGRAAGPPGRRQRWLHRPGSASPPSPSVLCWQARVRERKKTQKAFTFVLSNSGKASQKRLLWSQYD